MKRAKCGVWVAILEVSVGLIPVFRKVSASCLISLSVLDEMIYHPDYK